MKRAVALSLALILLLLPGCNRDLGAYEPTGKGLTWEEGDPHVETTEAVIQEKDLVLMYYPDVPMNPFTCADYTNRALFSLIYQGLFVTDSDYQVHPILCDYYTVSADNRTYTIYLRQDATFSDGTPVTIEDVLACYQQALVVDYYRGRFRCVTRVFLSEDGGISFYLNTAYENFCILLDVPIVKATEVEAAYPLGTGPYQLEYTNAGARLRLRKNWWCQAELPFTASSIPLQEAEDIYQIRDAFEFGDVGLVCANPGTESYADYRSDYELWDCENGIFLYIGCNTEKGSLFANTTLRKALTYAVDRDLLVDSYYHSFAYSASLPASPLSPYYSNQLAAKYAYDPAKFQSALAETGNVGSTVRILVNEGDTLRLRVARELGKILEGYGLVVEMFEYRDENYFYMLGIGKYDIYVGKTRLSPNMDLSPFFASNGALRQGGMADTVLYAMCQEALANKGNYYNLHQQVMEDGRLVPLLFHTYSIHVTRGLLTGLDPARDNVFHYTLGRTLKEALKAF